MYAIGADSHSARRAAAQDAIATARPDIVDRNGEILATDVKAPSLFGEPRRIIDKDEAIELLTATLPDLDVGEVRDRLLVAQGLRLAEARDHAEAAAGHPPARHSRHRLPAREQARLSDRQRGRPPDRPRQHRQPGHRRHGEVARQQRARRPASRRLRHRSPAAADRTVGRSARRARAARRAAQGEGEIPRQGGVRSRHQRQHRRDHRDGLAAGFRSEQSEGSARSRSHQPPDHRRLRDGLDVQGLHLGDGARQRQIRSQLAVGRARAAALRQVHDSRRRAERPLPQHEGGLHLLLQRRRGTHRAVAGRRGPQGLPAQDGPARPIAHRIAGERRAAGAEALERAQHHHHRLRPRHGGGAAAGGDGRQRAGEWRAADPADLPEAHARKRRGRSQNG